MTTFELRAPGADRLGAQLDDAARSLPGDVDDALTDYAATWLGVAVRTAPRDTGALAASLTATVTDSKASVTSPIRYAVPVEARNHWLARARGTTAADAAREVQAALDHATDQITGA